MNTIFEEKNDKNKEMQILLPANIRFSFYPTAEKVKLENKFAALPLKVPLTQSMETAYPQIQRVTKALKSSMGFIYGVYTISFWSALLCPKFVTKNNVEMISDRFTIGFSNTPGPIK